MMSCCIPFVWSMIALCVVTAYSYGKYGLHVTISFDDAVLRNETQNSTAMLWLRLGEYAVDLEEAATVNITSNFTSRSTGNQMTVINLIVEVCSQPEEDELFDAFNETGLQSLLEEIVENEVDIAVQRLSRYRALTIVSGDTTFHMGGTTAIVIIFSCVALVALCVIACTYCVCVWWKNRTRSRSVADSSSQCTEKRSKQRMRKTSQQLHDRAGSSSEEDELQSMNRVIKNALVMLVGVSDYDTKDDLKGVSIDMRKHRKLWEDVYKYRVLPDKGDPKWYGKTYWTYEDIEGFFYEQRGELLNSDGELQYDALIVVINGHGAKDVILPSDYDPRDQRNNVPIYFSALKGLVGAAWQKGISVTIPRIFMVDACRGSQGGGSVDLSRGGGITDFDLSSRRLSTVSRGSVDLSKSRRNSVDLSRSRMRRNSVEASRGPDRETTGHQDQLSCTVYGNAPGIQVKETVDGGKFTQCLVAELSKTKNTVANLCDIAAQVGQALKVKSSKAQLCWLEGDPQCSYIVFMKNDPYTYLN